MNRFVIADPKLGIGCHPGMADCTATDKRQGLQVTPRQTLVRVCDKTTPMTYRYGERVRCIRVCMTQATHLANHATRSESSKEIRLRTISMPSNMTKFAENQEGEK